MEKRSFHRELLKLNFGIALSNDQKKLELGFNVRVLFLAQKTYIISMIIFKLRA